MGSNYELEQHAALTGPLQRVPTAGGFEADPMSAGVDAMADPDVAVELSADHF